MPIDVASLEMDHEDQETGATPVEELDEVSGNGPEEDDDGDPGELKENQDFANDDCWEPQDPYDGEY